MKKYISLVILNIMDIATTYLSISIWQIAEEANPLFSDIINSGNYFPIILFKLIFLFILYPRKRYLTLPLYHNMMMLLVGYYLTIISYNSYSIIVSL